MIPAVTGAAASGVTSLSPPASRRGESLAPAAGDGLVVGASRLTPLPPGVAVRLPPPATVAADPLSFNGLASQMGCSYARSSARILAGEFLPAVAGGGQRAAAAAAVADAVGYAAKKPLLGLAAGVAAGVAVDLTDDGPWRANLHDAARALPVHVIGATIGSSTAAAGLH